MGVRVATFRLPPILAIFAGLVLAGLALISAMALVAVSVLTGLGHAILDRLRSTRRHATGSDGDLLTVEYEVVRSPRERDALSTGDERAPADGDGR